MRYKAQTNVENVTTADIFLRMSIAGSLHRQTFWKNIKAAFLLTIAVFHCIGNKWNCIGILGDGNHCLTDYVECRIDLLLGNDIIECSLVCSTRFEFACLGIVLLDYFNICICITAYPNLKLLFVCIDFDNAVRGFRAPELYCRLTLQDCHGFNVRRL